MSNDSVRSLSPVSYTSEGDSTRREFFDSARVKSSPTPTPLSETPRDFQLICGPTEIVAQADIKSDPSFTNGCGCGPECKEPCCVSIRGGWTTSKTHSTPSSVDESDKKQLELGDGKTAVTLPSSQTSYAEHDRVSLGSNDSGMSDHLGENRGKTPLLPLDEQHGGFAEVAIVSTLCRITMHNTCILCSWKFLWSKIFADGPSNNVSWFKFLRINVSHLL